MSRTIPSPPAGIPPPRRLLARGGNVALALLLGFLPVCRAVEPAPLTTLRAIHALSNAQAAQALPVAFAATVIYFRSSEGTLFVQDGADAIYVSAPSNLHLLLGDRVQIHGVTHPSFRPYVVPSSVTVLGHGSLPPPLPVDFAQMIGDDFDCRLVAVHGVVRAAGMVYTKRGMSIRLQVLTDGGSIDANVDSTDAAATEGLLDAEVAITGSVSGLFDSKMQMTGVLLHVPSLEDVKVLKRAPTDPWALPVTPMDRILTQFREENRSGRVRVKGTITYYQPGTAVVLQDGSKSLWINIMRDTSFPLRIGDLADASGFPDVENGFLILSDGAVRDDHVAAPIAPPLLSWSEISGGTHIYDLVSTEGQVVTEVRDGNQDEYLLRAGNRLFPAIYGHPFGGALETMKQIPLGAKVRVTGICLRSDSSPWGRQVPFKIMLRSFDDIRVLARPSLLNVHNLILLVVLLLAVVVLAVARGWQLEHKVRRQTAILAQRTEAEATLERRRRHILEDINCERSLPEILGSITAMVSSTLNGAPCWCALYGWSELAAETVLGIASTEQDRQRVVRRKIHARSGPPLGELFAAFPLASAPSPAEDEALTVGTQLATLAIETRKLYSDLRRRSEFDQLTDIANRFSLNQRLEALIEETHEGGAIFGLIYIDLDKFKPINDTHGHRVGDLYLQAVALRMSRQLPGGDMLARLGGDEFAALVQLRNGRSDMDAILTRLRHCFDGPFVIESHTLRGAASFGAALYPEDGATPDELLSAADAAMYAVKNVHKQAAAAATSTPAR